MSLDKKVQERPILPFLYSKCVWMNLLFLMRYEYVMKDMVFWCQTNKNTGTMRGKEQ